MEGIDGINRKLGWVRTPLAAMATTVWRTQSSLGPAEELEVGQSFLCGMTQGREGSFCPHPVGEGAQEAWGREAGGRRSAPACSVHLQYKALPLPSTTSAVPRRSSSKSASCSLKTYYVLVSWLSIVCPALVYKPREDRGGVCLVGNIVAGT